MEFGRLKPQIQLRELLMMPCRIWSYAPNPPSTSSPIVLEIALAMSSTKDFMGYMPQNPERLVKQLMT